MCGAPEQTAELPAGTDLTKESVLVGRVTNGGSPVGGAFVRLLDSTGEFTAEVVAVYRFEHPTWTGPWWRAMEWEHVRSVRLAR